MKRPGITSSMVKGVKGTPNSLYIKARGSSTSREELGRVWLHEARCRTRFQFWCVPFCIGPYTLLVDLDEHHLVRNCRTHFGCFRHQETSMRSVVRMHRSVPPGLGPIVLCNSDFGSNKKCVCVGGGGALLFSGKCFEKFPTLSLNSVVH